MGQKKVARQYCAKYFPLLMRILDPPLSPRPNAIAPKLWSKKIVTLVIHTDLSQSNFREIALRECIGPHVVMLYEILATL